ncbi:hypothetical protein DFJ73DRAFT_349095 [Zopfochytrium polystomum]|nr:hypothetical protein DFJ73DRAFT_349095 [Zopfochytrium polystomum]
MIIALKRQSEKQLEQIRRLEERDRIVHQQLQTVEKEMSTKSIAADLHRRKVTELTQKISEQTERYDKLLLRFNETERALKDKTRQLVEEADARRRTAESLEVTRRRLEVAASRAEASGGPDAALQKELEDYKLLLKCSSCTSRFKSHVLLRCMHTFCKECLDDLVSTRQRKCPKCGLGFSKEEIKEVYL